MISKPNEQRLTLEQRGAQARADYEKWTRIAADPLLSPEAALAAQPRHPYTRELLGAIPSADPDVQPARLARVLSGEPPSPLAPPSGCVYRTRCPHARPVCAQALPAWEALAPGEFVACHRWREL